MPRREEDKLEIFRISNTKAFLLLDELLQKEIPNCSGEDKLYFNRRSNDLDFTPEESISSGLSTKRKKKNNQTFILEVCKHKVYAQIYKMVESLEPDNTNYADYTNLLIILQTAVRNSLTIKIRKKHIQTFQNQVVFKGILVRVLEQIIIERTKIIDKYLFKLENADSFSPENIKTTLCDAANELIQNNILEKIQHAMNLWCSNLKEVKTIAFYPYITCSYYLFLDKCFTNKIMNRKLYADLLTLTHAYYMQDLTEEDVQTAHKMNLFSLEGNQCDYNINVAINALFNNRYVVMDIRSSDVKSSYTPPIDKANKILLLALKHRWHEVTNFYHRLHPIIYSQVEALFMEGLFVKDNCTSPHIESNYMLCVEKYYKELIKNREAIETKFGPQYPIYSDYCEFRINILRSLIDLEAGVQSIKGCEDKNSWCFKMPGLPETNKPIFMLALALLSGSTILQWITETASHS
ncbi:hypothetical protein NEAUS05_1025 [Nematocida ausubeli]|nr:hypothetical protein NEAUS07_0903 [Nematocida ausubeli]KAI5147738.1 hypothetical protein NEAUS05_1025 [Nematocida ausubeli]